MTASTPRLPASAGSLREGSYHGRPVPADGARAAGAGVGLIALRDVPLPPCDGAIEAAGMPGNVWVAAGVAS